MTDWVRLVSRGRYTVLGMALIAAVGCLGDGQAKVYPVMGEVTLDGTPLAEATVVFHRDDGQGRNLTAITGSDGKYRLTTFSPADGAPAGDYRVTVEYRELVQEGDEKSRTGRNLIPDRYANPQTSELKCRVEERDNALPPWQLRSK